MNFSCPRFLQGVPWRSLLTFCRHAAGERGGCSILFSYMEFTSTVVVCSPADILDTRILTGILVSRISAVILSNHRAVEWCELAIIFSTVVFPFLPSLHPFCAHAGWVFDMFVYHGAQFSSFRNLVEILIYNHFTRWLRDGGTNHLIHIPLCIARMAVHQEWRTKSPGMWWSLVSVLSLGCVLAKPQHSQPYCFTDDTNPHHQFSTRTPYNYTRGHFLPLDLVPEGN